MLHKLWTVGVVGDQGGPQPEGQVDARRWEGILGDFGEFLMKIGCRNTEEGGDEGGGLYPDVLAREQEGGVGDDQEDFTVSVCVDGEGVLQGWSIGKDRSSSANSLCAAVTECCSAR